MMENTGWTFLSSSISTKQSTESLIIEILILAVVEFLVLYIIKTLFTPADVETRKRGEFALDFLCIPMASLLWLLALSSVINLSGSSDMRWFGLTNHSYMFSQLYVSHNLVQTFFELSKDEPFVAKIPLVGHHFFSIIAYGGGMYFGRLHFWASLAGMCEITNIPLNILYLCKVSGGKAFGERLKKKIGILYTFNGVILWVFFIIFRIILFPLWYYLWRRDILIQKTSKGFASAEWRNITQFEFWFYPTVIFLLFLLSSWWFFKLTMGMIKVFRGHGTKLDRTHNKKTN